MEVSELLLVSVGIRGPQQLLEPPDSRDPQDGEATVAAEGLQQGEVDLQRHVVRVVSRQDAQDHTVRVSEGGQEGKVTDELCVGWSYFLLYGRCEVDATHALRSLADS